MKKFNIYGFFIIFLLTGSLVAQEVSDLKVGSYNIRYDNDGDRKAGNSWDDRLPVITSIINWEEPDIFGSQEVLVDQFDDMKSKLPDYNVYGVGRDDGKEAGEFAPVFFKKDRFKLLDSGTFWLSETPEEPGKKGWDAALPRICSWVKLKEKDSGKKLWFFNLHMDHVGIKAREKSSKLVLKKVKEKTNGDPAFLTGDFNVDQTNEIYDILAKSDILYDSFETASLKMAWNGTFNAFDSETWTDSRIDHIFVTKNIKVNKYAVLTETYRSLLNEDDVKKGDFPEELSSKPAKIRIPSDHFPIFSRVQLK